MEKWYKVNYSFNEIKFIIIKKETPNFVYDIKERRLSKKTTYESIHKTFKLAKEELTKNKEKDIINIKNMLKRFKQEMQKIKKIKKEDIKNE